MSKSAAKSDSTDPAEPTFAEAMRDLIGKRWGAVWVAVPVAIEGVDPEGVHDVRVASRRLRAAMDVAVESFPASWYKPLHRSAKMITRELGEVRDRDVLIESLEKDRATAPPEEWPGIDRLIARIDRERQEARKEMERFLNELITGNVPADVVRRFGPDAAIPQQTPDSEQTIDMEPAPDNEQATGTEQETRGEEEA